MVSQFTSFIKALLAQRWWKYDTNMVNQDKFIMKEI